MSERLRHQLGALLDSYDTARRAAESHLQKVKAKLIASMVTA